MINGDGYEDPGEDPNRLLNSFCVPCAIGQFCPGREGEWLRRQQLLRWGLKRTAERLCSVRCAIGQFCPGREGE